MLSTRRDEREEADRQISILRGHYAMSTVILTTAVFAEVELAFRLGGSTDINSIWEVLNREFPQYTGNLRPPRLSETQGWHMRGSIDRPDRAAHPGTSDMIDLARITAIPYLDFFIVTQLRRELLNSPNHPRQADLLRDRFHRSDSHPQGHIGPSVVFHYIQHGQRSDLSDLMQ